MDSANRLLDAAQEIQRFCRDRGWPFCFIGGIAVQHWGEARLTRDADVTVFTGFGNELSYVDALLTAFAPRIVDARTFAVDHRVVLLRATNGIPLDITLAALPFEEKAIIPRARRKSFRALSFNSQVRVRSSPSKCLRTDQKIGSTWRGSSSSRVTESTGAKCAQSDMDH